MSRLADILTRLQATIESRKGGDVSASWTAKLLAHPKLAAKKLGEEALETALADDADDTAKEAADTLYHLLVLLTARGVSLDAVAEVLEGREGVSGIAEKAGRK